MKLLFNLIGKFIYNHLLLFIALSYSVPVILFGNFNLIGKFIYFPISVAVLLFLVDYKSELVFQRKNNLSNWKNLRRYLSSKFASDILISIFFYISLSIYDIFAVPNLKINQSIVTVTLISNHKYAHLNALPVFAYFFSAIFFTILVILYRIKKREEYVNRFEGNPILLKRDEKINEIIKW